MIFDDDSDPFSTEILILYMHPFEGNFNGIPKSEYYNGGIAFIVI